MKGKAYISCIKINGVPILPPMMTEEIREEMSNYKQIAIAIEKKLTAVCTTEACANIDNKATLEKQLNNKYTIGEVYSSKESLPSPLDSNIGSIDSGSHCIEKQHFSDISSENMGDTVRLNEKLGMQYKSEEPINLISSIATKPEVTLFNSDTIESLRETWKHKVPKTLDVIPLIHNTSNNCKNTEQYTGSTLSNEGDAPKLVRQGSYVLDTPSPILLAHMQMELVNSAHTRSVEYIPSSDTNTTRRKEWNIAQAKMEWECESKTRDSVPQEFEKLVSDHERSSRSNKCHRIRKSLSLQMKPVSSPVPRSSTRSLDCIQTVLTEELLNESNMENHKNGVHISNNNKRKHRFKKWKRCNSFSPFKSTYKVGGSLENLSSSDMFCSECDDRKHNGHSASNDSIKNTSVSTEMQDFATIKLKPSITSDKLFAIYKRVQEMHKKQMAELVSRQQKEQMLLQKEFEKQLLVLINEIKKSFPKVSLPLLSENVLSPTFNEITSKSEQLFENINDSTRNIKNLRINLQRENGTECSRDSNSKIILCPLDDICSEMNSSNVDSCSIKHSQLLRTSGSNIDSSAAAPEKEELTRNQAVNLRNRMGELIKENDMCKRSHVSRQLFPLDCKTTHVPILERVIYEAKHIKATNIINAYARGYLIRRMMRTERVITLKNTYKEALHCMLKLHVDAPLNRSEFNFLRRLRLQCDAASMNIVELFAQSPKRRMQVIAQDREIKQSRTERPTSARSYSFATQRTLARKKLKEMDDYPPSSFARSYSSRARCQTWTSNVKDNLISPNILYHTIKRSTSAGTVRRPWR